MVDLVVVDAIRLHVPTQRAGEPVDLAEMVADEHRPTGSEDLPDDVGNKFAGLLVQPFPGLVQDQQFRPGNQTLDQADLLGRAFRDVGEVHVEVPGQEQALAPGLDLFRGGGSAEPMRPGHTDEVRTDCERLVRREPLGNPTDARGSVQNPSPLRRQKPCSGSEECALAGSVPPNHHGNFAWRYRDVDRLKHPA